MSENIQSKPCLSSQDSLDAAKQLQGSQNEEYRIIKHAKLVGLQLLCIQVHNVDIDVWQHR